MTNKEKANEVAKKHMSFCGVPITECINASLEMAEWKDKQYAKVLANLLIELDELKHQVKSLLL